MLSKKSTINTELKAICRFRSLMLSRIMLILLLLLLSYPFHFLTLYPAAAFLVIPGIASHGICSKHPGRDQLYLAKASLPETMKAFHFLYSKYYAEKITSGIITLLMAAWQMSQPRTLWNGLPVWIIPAVLFLIYFITGNLLYLYYRIKLHYDFMHLNIK